MPARSGCIIPIWWPIWCIAKKLFGSKWPTLLVSISLVFVFGNLCSFFHFILLFWNQIFIWRSDKTRECAISILRLLVRYLWIMKTRKKLDRNIKDVIQFVWNNKSCLVKVGSIWYCARGGCCWLSSTRYNDGALRYAYQGKECLQQNIILENIWSFQTCRKLIDKLRIIGNIKYLAFVHILNCRTFFEMFEVILSKWWQLIQNFNFMYRYCIIILMYLTNRRLVVMRSQRFKHSQTGIYYWLLIHNNMRTWDKQNF